jgi:hypothetical protein
VKLQTTLILSLIVLLASCTNVDEAVELTVQANDLNPTPMLAPTQVPTVTEAVTEAAPILPTDTPVPSLTPSDLADSTEIHPQYTITATLDYGWRYLSARQVIHIPNTSPDIISELSLIVQPAWRPGAFTLNAMRWEDGTEVTSYTLEGTLLRVLLLAPLNPGEYIQLSLDYEINIPPILTSEDFGPNPFGYTSRQINMTDWYPFVPPYVDGTGWLVNNIWYYGEHLVYPMADYDVTVELTNAPEETTIAASSLDTGDQGVYRYQAENTRSFVFSASHDYRVFREQVGEVTVLGYVFPYDVVPGEAAFKTTVRAMKLYNELFGPYPYEGLTMIQADFDHGMEYSGLYFLSKAFFSTYDGTPSTYLVTIAAHETAHQWWYGLVGNDPALEPWLDEALCTYSEKIFYENLFPQSLNWWSYARVKFYDPVGWVDSTIYNTTSYRAYRDAVYLRGALFLDALRARVGDEAFFAFLQDYLNQNTNRIASREDFFSILKEHTVASWEDLMQEYFYNP